MFVPVRLRACNGAMEHYRLFLPGIEYIWVFLYSAISCTNTRRIESARFQIEDLVSVIVMIAIELVRFQ